MVITWILGHPSSSILNHVKPTDCDLSSSNTIFFPVCTVSKQCKLPFFSASKSHATEIFDLIHIDICMGTICYTFS